MRGNRVIMASASPLFCGGMTTERETMDSHTVITVATVILAALGLMGLLKSDIRELREDIRELRSLMTQHISGHTHTPPADNAK